VIENLITRLVEKVEGRFYGKYRAFVVDNADPENRGRLKLRIPSVLGAGVVSGWALPCAPYGGDAEQGFFFVPEVDAAVWAEFEAGDLDYPIWVGTFWCKPGGTSEVPLGNKPADGSEESSVPSPPTRKLIKTLKGHSLQFEDADGDEMVLLLEAANGNLVVLNSNGITLTDKTGNVIEMKTNGFTITSKVAFKIDASGQAVTIIGDTIDLNKG
jgi:uncharacterized protein involved in type VI secretion and phage assembly